MRRYLANGGNANREIQYMSFGKISAPLLTVAIYYGQADTVSLLLEKGANPNQRDSSGKTPLRWAIGQGGEIHEQIIKMLLKNGASPNLRDSSGWTPLISAVSLDQSDIVGILLDGGAQVSATNSEGLTALHFAGKTDIARLLIAKGADPRTRTGGETPIESAIRRGKFEVLIVLTNSPVQTNRISQDPN